METIWVTTICAIHMLVLCAACAVTLTAIVTTTMLIDQVESSTPMATISLDSSSGEAPGELKMASIPQLIRMENRKHGFNPRNLGFMERKFTILHFFN